MDKNKQAKNKDRTDTTEKKVRRRHEKLFGSLPYKIWFAAVAILAVSVAAYWLYAGQAADFALLCGAGVLIVCSPAPLYFSSLIMLALLKHTTVRRGAHFNSLKAVRKLMTVDTLAVNKNGIITMGKPHIADIVTEGMTKKTLLKLAASAEKDATHPIGKAIVRAADEQNLVLSRLAAFHEIAGSGVEAIVNNAPVRVGSLAWLKKERVKVSATLATKNDQLATRGKIPVFVSSGKYARGIIALQDDIISDSVAAVHRLQGLGLSVIMLTTESSRTANAVQKVTLLDGAIGSLSAMDKIRELQLLRTKSAGVAMLGDTFNEPALFVAADLSIHLLPFIPPGTTYLSKRRVETADMEAKAKAALAELGPPVDPNTVNADLVLTKGLNALVAAVSFALNARKIEQQNFRPLLIATMVLFVPASGFLSPIGGWVFTLWQDCITALVMFALLTVANTIRLGT